MSEPLVTLQFVDYLVILVYLAGMMLIGYWVSRSVHSGADFFLAGRSLPWWAVGFSLVATDIGGTDMVGLGGAGHKYGIAAANFDWIGCVPAMLVGAFIFIPHFWRCGITTIPELLERRFDIRVRSAVSISWFLFMACNLGVMLVASSTFMAGLANWSPWFTILVVITLVTFCTYSGGLAAVVYTDVLQSTVMIACCLTITAIGLWDVGGWADLQTAVDKSLTVRSDPPVPSAERATPANTHFDLVLPVDSPTPYPWPAILLGLTLVVSPSYWIGNQCIVQRALAARSEYEAKASYVWGALLKNIIPIVIVLPGILALARFPELDKTDFALPKLISRTFAPGLRGVFVAAFITALMSSVDSYINSATTLFTVDFYKRLWRPDADERRLLGVGRAVTILMAVWAVAFATVLMQVTDSGVYSIFQTLLAFIQGPAFAVLMCGMLTRWATATGAFVGFLSGVLTTVMLFLLSRPYIAERLGTQPIFRNPEQSLYFSMWAFLVAVAVTLGVSYGQKPPTEENLKYVLTRRQRGGDI